ncbi:hypothetical protein HX004_16960 [Myroides sp. 1354]|uniref:hypothetical protein n=1 Tax=unclassified Myroides TaxID=2642485 RepID=UPI002575A160|nr:MULTISPECIES: hypothetical protein [unclassified Myroides]MDM1046494.1 hypothetical protein [Myroides sp. R163-1]MDM1057448.1 hypothetical protein [Myroides sp. 1354]MDM1070733.1 hypothetical protein [Myroides sp. 1372]
MKRLFFFSLTLVLLSCSNEEPTASSTLAGKDIQQSHPDINVDTPYKYDSINGDGMRNNYLFIIRNDTDFTFKFAAHSGLAVYDGADDLKYWGHNLTTTNSPNLTANGHEYGNYINYDYVFINARTIESHNSQYINPIYYTQPIWNANGTLANDPRLIPQNATQTENNFLAKLGKIYFLKFEAYDGKTPIAGSIVKSSFPHNYDANNLPTSGNWARTHILDSYFQEELIYNKHTKEIFLPTGPNSTFSDTSTFEYQGINYTVGFRTDASKVEIYIEEAI